MKHDWLIAPFLLHHSASESNHAISHRGGIHAQIRRHFVNASKKAKVSRVRKYRTTFILYLFPLLSVCFRSKLLMRIFKRGGGRSGLHWPKPHRAGSARCKFHDSKPRMKNCLAIPLTILLVNNTGWVSRISHQKRNHPPFGYAACLASYSIPICCLLTRYITPS